MMEFEPLIGEWHGEREVPVEHPMKIFVEAKIERLGRFIVCSSVGEPPEVPASVSIIGGAQDGQPQPMHYFDGRGVKRLHDGGRRLHLEDLAGARRGLERAQRPRLQPALHRRDLS